MRTIDLKAVLVAAAIVIAVTAVAEYAVLKKAFKKKYAVEEQVEFLDGDKAGSLDEAGLRRKLKALEARHKSVLAVAKAKDKKIARLQAEIRGSSGAGFSQTADNGPQFIPAGTVSFANSSRKEMGEKLGEFLQQISEFMDDEEAAALDEQFGGFVAKLMADDPSVSVEERKQTELQRLQVMLASSQNEGRKKKLQKRIDAINNASPEDLANVLSYYQRLDDINKLNGLMKRFNISREELRLAGIEPPPRSDWSPDVLEVAMNLDTFAEMYRPLVPADRQEQFSQDFATYLEELTKVHSNAEAQRQKEKWIADMQKQLEGAKGRKKKWLERRIKGLEKSSLAHVKKHMRYKTMGELNHLASEYDIPRNELIQSGAMIGRYR